jgi:hypothetical protein
VATNKEIAQQDLIVVLQDQDQVLILEVVQFQEEEMVEGIVREATERNVSIERAIARVLPNHLLVIGVAEKRAEVAAIVRVAQEISLMKKKSPNHIQRILATSLEIKVQIKLMVMAEEPKVSMVQQEKVYQTLTPTKAALAVELETE